MKRTNEIHLCIVDQLKHAGIDSYISKSGTSLYVSRTCMMNMFDGSEEDCFDITKLYVELCFPAYRFYWAGKDDNNLLLEVYK